MENELFEKRNRSRFFHCHSPSAKPASRTMHKNKQITLHDPLSIPQTKVYIVPLSLSCSFVLALTLTRSLPPSLSLSLCSSHPKGTRYANMESTTLFKIVTEKYCLPMEKNNQIHIATFLCEQGKMVWLRKDIVLRENEQFFFIG